MPKPINNLIVIAFIIIILVSGIFQKGYSPPINDPYLNDYAGIINKHDEYILKQVLTDIHENDGLHIAIATIVSIQNYTFSDKSIESFSFNVYHDWKNIGISRDLDVLILMSIENRKIRIEFGGNYGGKYNSQINQIIQSDILPFFRKHEYSVGVLNGVQAISTLLTGRIADDKPVMADSHDIHNIWGSIIEDSDILKIIAFFLTGISFIYWAINNDGYDTYDERGYRRSGGYWGGDGGGFGGDGSGSGGGDGDGGGSGDGGSGGW
ncbi:MAG TPA: TPM domain-containing protein [Anaerolineales bacterium]|nr:TPM domain-containing protein [Anaerolineales bacterium]